MKAFRGTFLAAGLLLVVGGAWYLLKPDIEETTEGGPRLFEFEKHELARVSVQRPDGNNVVLVEKDGKWTIEGTDFVAGRSMVNRVKHQLHDLTARATVVEDPDMAELYGLGDNAIEVELTMRGGDTLRFRAGDPNPSSVSYYIQPIPGEIVYTVKKSAVDYYSLSLDEFRERRFAGFDSKDVTRYTATLRLDGAPATLDIEKLGDRSWEMLAPEKMAASDDRVRRLMGRVSALKAKDFIELGEAGSDEQLAQYGLVEPRVDLTIRFASRDPLHLLVGADAESENKLEALAYMMFADDDTIYVARRGMLDEYSADLTEYRNRRVVRMQAADVVAVDATLRPTESQDLAGVHGVRLAAGDWFWKDGVPVPGSTPERVARQLAEMEVESFVDDAAADLVLYGLDNPVARVVLTDEEASERIVLIGSNGEARLGPEGQESPRRYAAIEGDPSVYLVDERVLRVVEDMIREGNRKAKKDLEKAERRERIPSEALPADDADQ
jgi:hypothetical protein